MLSLTILAAGALAQTASTAPATQATRPTQPARPGRTYALLVGGLPGSPVYARRHRDWLKRLHALLVKAGVPAQNIVVLSGDKDFKDNLVKGQATAQSILKAIEDFALAAGPQDQFVLAMVGHGSSSDERPALVLPGPDLGGEKLAQALGAIAAQNQVVLNFSGCSGQFLKPLARKGRVNVSALMPEESGEPVYAEFFLRGLESARADGEGAPAAGEKDGTVTVLEAYNWAACQTAQWISRQQVTEDKTWTVQGKESVEIFKKLCEGAEGDPGSRKLDPASDASKEDPVVQIVLPRDPAAARAFGDRRVVIEHATLEDQGLEAGLTALRGEKGYEPIVGSKAGEEGCLAARTILGRPQRAEPAPK